MQAGSSHDEAQPFQAGGDGRPDLFPVAMIAVGVVATLGWSTFLAWTTWRVLAWALA